jgi:hypothetical protein
MPSAGLRLRGKLCICRCFEFKIFYREAGDPQQPTLRLLHGSSAWRAIPCKTLQIPCSAG